VISGWWMVFCNKFVYQQPATIKQQQATNIQFFVIARNPAEGGMTKQSRSKKTDCHSRRLRDRNDR